MRIVVFTSKNNIYANKIIKELFKIHDIKIAGVIESSVIYPGKGNLNAIFSILKKSGFSYLFSQIIKFAYFKVGSTIYELFPGKNVNNILFSYSILSKKYKVPIFVEKDINSKIFIKKMSNLNPDLFISVFLNQIFKSGLLSVPKLGILNIHPALLPSYKGLSPIFWALRNGEKKAGITIHWITDKIDSGEILAQKEIQILPTDTEFSLYFRSVNEVLPILRKTINDIGNGKNKIIKNINVRPSYYSFPTTTDVKKFKDRGRKFLTLKELFSLH